MNLLETTIQNITPVASHLDEAIQQKLDHLTKPPGSLGRLEELAKTLCRIKGNLDPDISKKAICVFAADHGVAESGVSAFPQEVTAQMVLNFIAGGAAINVLARQAGAKVHVVDVGVKTKEFPSSVINKKVALGTRNMSCQPAMTYEEARRSIEAGIEVVNQISQEVDLLGLGEMGIGNTTAASAVVAVLTGQAVSKITGRGTGLTDQQKENKIAIIEQAIKLNQPNSQNPIDVLCKVGGFEIGAIAGAVLAASAKKIPVLMDGFISSAGVLVAAKLAPACRDYLIASHQSVEPGHQAILSELKLHPYLDMNMRLGEGTGAALLMSVAESSLKILKEMATFESAGVSEKQ